MTKAKAKPKPRGKPRRYLNKLEYATHRGVAPQTITHAVKSGRITVISAGKYKGKIDKVLADEQWNENRMDGKESKPPVGNAPAVKERSQLQDAKTKKEMIIAERELIKLRKLKGELIDKAEVIHAVGVISRQNRDMWLNWPKTIATQLAEEYDEDPSSGLMYDLINKAVREHLDSIATMNFENVTNKK